MMLRGTKRPLLALALIALATLAGCRSGGTEGAAMPGGRATAQIAVDNAYIVVNSLRDVETPDLGEVTLRAALAALADGGTIAFAPSLDNGTIDLSIVGEAHSTLKGELFWMGYRFDGFLERDYGASALYAAKSVDIDASMLPSGITLRWAGGDANRARILAVLGDLTVRNVTFLDGFSSFAPIDNNPDQPYTLARGGAVANWGAATYENCTFGGNRVAGDNNSSRDRGAFGGAVYGDAIEMDNCVVSGNRAEGYGAAGGGVYSVSGREAWPAGSNLRNCSVTGNRVAGLHAYGGGVYTDGGGRAHGALVWSNPLRLVNCTVARNVVRGYEGVPDNVQRYARGGGVYMSNGWLVIASCTIAENEVTGQPGIFSGKPNVGGGGVAATIGNAHVVEDMGIWHSVLVGNRVNGVAEDLYTGSLVNFFSMGYNRVGRIDFSQMLAAIPTWECLNRNHWPIRGDFHGATVADSLLVVAARKHPTIRSAGTDDGQPALLWYPPADALADRIPPASYSIAHRYVGFESPTDNNVPLIDAVLARLRTVLSDPGFGGTLPDYSGLHFYVEPNVWPSWDNNRPWIAFWRAVDNEIGDRMGPQRLGEDFWKGFEAGALGDDGTLTVSDWAGAWNMEYASTTLEASDQRGASRSAGGLGDIGAVERTAGETPPPPISIPAGNALPDGTAGAPYSQAFAASGGYAPYRWTIASGTLPPGLALDNAAGVVSGTPEAAGTFTFTVRVTGADDLAADRAYTVTIQAAPAAGGSGGGGCAAAPGESGGLATALPSLLAIAMLRRRRAGSPAA